MADKTTAIILARQFVEACMKGGVPVFSAWLFGSYAKGIQHEDSDIDLALISDAFTINFIENNHKTALINYEFPDIEVHHFNTQIFKIDDPFINEIKKTGIKIF
jgi:predicted nucleotidyltransferase